MTTPLARLRAFVDAAPDGVLVPVTVLREMLAGIDAPPEPPPAPAPNGDKLLTVNEAAELLGVSRRWVYRKAGKLPFTRKLSSGTLRFSEKGLERWKASR